MKFAIFSLLAFTILPLAHADETHIFQLCNNMNYAVAAAISEREVSDTPGGRVTKGWFTAQPGTCANIPIHNEYFYIHVRGRVGNQVRVIIPQPSEDPATDTTIDYCFDPDSSFEYHGMYTGYCPNGPREVFHDWYSDTRGWRWDLR